MATRLLADRPYTLGLRLEYTSLRNCPKGEKLTWIAGAPRTIAQPNNPTGKLLVNQTHPSFIDSHQEIRFLHTLWIMSSQAKETRNQRNISNMNTEIRLNRMKTWRKQAKQREGNFKTITAKRSLSRNGTPRWDLKAEKEL